MAHGRAAHESGRLLGLERTGSGVGPSFGSRAKRGSAKDEVVRLPHRPTRRYDVRCTMNLALGLVLVVSACGSGSAGGSSDSGNDAGLFGNVDAAADAGGGRDVGEDPDVGVDAGSDPTELCPGICDTTMLMGCLQADQAICLTDCNEYADAHTNACSRCLLARTNRISEMCIGGGSGGPEDCVCFQPFFRPPADVSDCSAPCR